MTGGTKIKRKTNAKEDDAYRSEDESANASRASAAKKKKKKSSVASTAASTSSSAKRKASKKKAMKKADSLMSGLTGMSDHHLESNGKKKKVPKDIDRTETYLKENIDNDAISCLTETSKTSKASKASRASRASKSTRGTSTKRRKKRSSSKKSKKKDFINENRNPDSPSNHSERSRRSRSGSKKKIKHIPASRLKNDDEISTSSEKSGSKRSKSKTKDPSKDLSTLERRDRLYRNKSKKSMASSLTSAYYSRDDLGNDSLRSMRSTSNHSRTSTASSRSNTRKKSNKFGPDGNVRLKILPDGTVKASVPKRTQSVDRNHLVRANSVRDSDSDDVSLSDSSDEESRSSRRGMRSNFNRSNSLDDVRQMALVSQRQRHIPASSVPTVSRGHPPPVRIAARGNSVEVRSVSADHVRDMQRHLVRNGSHRSVDHARNANPNMNGRLYVAPSAREAPLRRGVSRNSSAPLRSAMRPSISRTGSARGPYQQHRGPLRSTKSAYLQQAQRRPPGRTSSKELTTAQHVEMLRGLTMGSNGPSSRNFDNNSQRRRSTSQPPGGPQGMHGDSRHGRRSLSPSRGILRSSSHRGDRSVSNRGDRNFSNRGDRSVSNRGDRSDRGFSNKEFRRENSLYKNPSKSDIMDTSDLDPYDLEDQGSMKLNNEEESESERELLNDSKHVIGFDTRDTSGIDRRDMSTTKSKRLSRSSSEGSLFGFSTHSYQSNRSQMSIDAKESFEDDPKWKVPLRYLHLLPPYKGESKLHRKIRIFTWISMLLDFIAAMVAVIQYSGSTMCCGEQLFDTLMNINWDALFRVVTVMYMCMIFAEIVPVIKNGIPFNIVNPAIGLLITFGMFFDDEIAEAVLMWVIEALAIFFEFMVYRVNARIYFETTFKLSQVDEEIEALKKKRKQYVEDMMNGNSRDGGSMHGSWHGSHGSFHGSRQGSWHGSHGSFHGSRHGSRHGPTHHSRDRSRSRDLEMGRSVSPPHQRPYYDDDDDESLSGHSFGGDDDEDFHDELSPSGRSIKPNNPAPRIMSRQGSKLHEQVHRPSTLNRAQSRDVLGSSTHSYGGSTAITGITGMTGGKIRLPGEIKMNKLLRKRRILRENKKAESNELHYHFVGTILNIGLAVVAMIFIVTIASTVSSSTYLAVE